MAASTRDPEELRRLIADLAPLAASVQRGRLARLREELELDEMYYEQKGSELGLARVRSCLAAIDARMEQLEPD
ncbi:MAG: hypothetical protein AB1568_00635 [Thermodesulfobacteriota bacterium]